MLLTDNRCCCKSLDLAVSCSDVQHTQRLEAQRLVRASFGETMLHCVGKVYEIQADIYLGGLFDGTWARVQQSRESIKYVAWC